MRRQFQRIALLAALALASAAAASQFPPLTGRVVDAAGMLRPDTRATLTAQLEALERASGIQLVVATVPDLGGEDLETYSNDLARAWGIGQKGRDNGVVLLIAKAERKVRIEVGYGLEGDLTDAMSSHIINTRIVPAFRRGDIDAGVRAGVEGIEEVLGYPVAGAQPVEQRHPGREHAFPVGLFWLIVLIIVMSGFGGGRRGGGGLARAIIWGSVLNNMGRRGSGRGGFGGGGFGGGGGFHGGGGSFGGGGASGNW